MTFSKKIYFILIISCLINLSALVNSNASIRYTKIDGGNRILGSLNEKDLLSAWGGEDHDAGSSIDVDHEGNIYIAGYTYSYGSGGSDWLLMKYNPQGNIKWNTTWGESNDDAAYSLKVDENGNIFVAGGLFNGISDNVNLSLVKLDSLGNQKWNISWGGAEDDYATSMEIFNDTNIYICGITNSYGKGNYDIFLLKYNKSGSLKWNITWGGLQDDFARFITLDSSENIYITGDTYSYGAGDRDALLIKFDNQGNQLWNRTWGGADIDIAKGVDVNNADDIIITGNSRSFNQDASDIFVVKYNSSGVEQWNKTYGIYWDSGNAVIIDDNDNIYITGMLYFYDPDDENSKGRQVCLIKYDPNGNRLWERTWGGLKVDWGFCLALDNQNNIYISGMTNSFSEGDYDVFLLRYNTNGALIWSNPSLTYENPINIEFIIIIFIGAFVSSAGIILLIYFIKKKVKN